MSVLALNRLRKKLGRLVGSNRLIALKTGTEVEDMSFEDIHLLRKLSQDILPLHVKIGGPEARNDIRELQRIGVDALIAPMIESPYALKNYILTMKEVLGTGYDRMEKGINLETITGFSNMNLILASDEAQELKQITAARSDLSGSMGLHPDAPRVMEICSVIVARAQEYELRTSVGGSIHAGIVDEIVKKIHPDRINTRHMVIPVGALHDGGGEVVVESLHFEAELYDVLSRQPGMRRKAYARRAEIIRQRLATETSLIPGNG